MARTKDVYLWFLNIPYTGENSSWFENGLWHFPVSGENMIENMYLKIQNALNGLAIELCAFYIFVVYVHSILIKLIKFMCYLMK